MQSRSDGCREHKPRLPRAASCERNGRRVYLRRVATWLLATRAEGDWTMTEQPTVSVIVPFHSNKTWLMEALESVLDQTLQAAEVIVICDGCECDLTDVAGLDPRIRVITTENRGPGSARNLGIEAARGEFIAFLDSDDLWDPAKTEKQLQDMIATHADWSHTSYTTFVDGEPQRAVRIVRSGSRHVGDVFPDLLSTCLIATPTVIIRSDVLRANSLLRFSQSLRFGEDAVLWAKLAIGHPILGIDLPLAKVRLRGHNAAMNPEVQLYARAAVWTELQRQPTTFSRNDVPWIVRTAFDWCVIARAMHSRMARPLRLNYALRRGLSRLLYFMPWITFKSAALASRLKKP